MSHDVSAPPGFAFIHPEGHQQSSAAVLPEPEIRKASVEDYKFFYPGQPVPTFDGIVAEINGKPVAIGGFCHYAGYVVAFVDLREEARPYFMHLYRLAHSYMEKARVAGYRYVYAKRDPNQDTADRFVRRFGFVPKDDIIYEWKN